jgi:hypothetical protein
MKLFIKLRVYYKVAVSALSPTESIDIYTGLLQHLRTADAAVQVSRGVVCSWLDRVQWHVDSFLCVSHDVLYPHI